MSYTLAYTGAEIDALLGKIDAIFVAEYGSTIYSEVTAAIAAGNKVIVANAGKVYVYAGQDDNSGYVFTQSGPNAAKPNATYVTLSTGNVWSTATVDLATLQQFYASLMEDTASGSIASFPDGAEGVPVKELTAEIEPLQDLHGQASPYPPNGGKNKLPLTVDGIKALNTGGSWSGNAYTYIGSVYTLKTDNAGNITSITVTGTPTGDSYLQLCEDDISGGSYLFNGCPNTGLDTTYYIGYRADSETAQKLYSNTDISVSVTSHFSAWIQIKNRTANNLTFYPMLRLSTEADATFAPYSNICPILGFTGANIAVTGNNLFNGNVTQNKAMALTGPYNSNGMGYTARILVKPNEDYYVYGVAGYNQHRGVIFYDADDNPISAIAGVAGTGPTYRAFTIPANCASIIINFMLDTIGVSARLCVGDDDGYAPYNPDSTVYSVSWSDHGAVYKGTLTYLGNSTWKVVSKYASVDAGTKTWGATSTSWTQCTDITNAKAFANADTATITSSVFVADSANHVYGHNKDNTIAVSSGGVIQLYSSTLLVGTLSAEQVAAALSGVQILYELATPVEFTVTGPDPETLLGDNNIWSDTGDISVKYRANTALYIEKKLGE